MLLCMNNEHAYPLSTKTIERSSQLAKLQMCSNLVSKPNQNIDTTAPNQTNRVGSVKHNALGRCPHRISKVVKE